LGFYNNPGLALLLDAIFPVAPWIKNLNHADLVLELIDPKTIKEAIIELHVNDVGWHRHLPKKLLDFPAG
jgi:hypothetical protein